MVAFVWARKNAAPADRLQHAATFWLPRRAVIVDFVEFAVDHGQPN
jgi:hypothetical protein